jgi:penicillin-binding protein 1A
MASASASSSVSITNKKIPFHKRHPTFVRVVLLSLTFLISLGVGALYGTWALICRGSQCPSIEILSEYQPHQTSKLYAVDGRFIAELGLEKRTLVKIDEIPKIVQDAFVSTEDKRFYQHAGIDWHRAASVVLIADPWLLARLLHHHHAAGPQRFPGEDLPRKSPVRKIKEAKVAREIEAKYDKKKILELTSIRSTSATALTESRPRRSDTSANPSVT